jgi:hypothetical protein
LSPAAPDAKRSFAAFFPRTLFAAVRQEAIQQYVGGGGGADGRPNGRRDDWRSARLPNVNLEKPC